MESGKARARVVQIQPSVQARVAWMPTRSGEAAMLAAQGRIRQALSLDEERGADDRTLALFPTKGGR